MKLKKILLLALATFAISCSSEDHTNMDSNQDEALYFPPIGSDTWASKTPESLGWNTNNLQ